MTSVVEPGAESWRAVHEQLSNRPPDELTPAQQDRLAEALFWLNRRARSAEVRRHAYRGWLAAGAHDRAALSAWRLFYEHWLVGERAVAQGWLARVVRHASDARSPVAGWLAIAQCDVSLAEGRLDAAVADAGRACLLGEETGDADLLAMALQAEGRAYIAIGKTQAGLARLDEAMVAVIGDELDPHYVGWIYCNVLSACIGVADLRRAREWNAAALRWCAELREGLLYPGLCRVYRAQLAQLGGDWSTAEAEARQACAELAAYDRRYAGAAHYVVADVCRLRGQADEAESAFERAHELGCDPQPGLSLLHAEAGRREEALAALRQLGGVGGSILRRLQCLLALIEVARELGLQGDVASAADRVVAIAGEVGSEVARAWSLSARGQAALVRGDSAQAIDLLRASIERLDDLGLPHEVARGRLLLAQAAAAAGDQLTARLERAAGAAALEKLGATGPSSSEGSPADGAPDLEPETGAGPLTQREVEVIALVAQGLTNRDVARRLHLSPHTVARHLSNVTTKLGVRSRTAAVTEAMARGLLRKVP